MASTPNTNAIANWLSGAAAEVNKVLKAVGATIHELAGSKRAALGVLAVAVPAAAQAFPQYAPQINAVLPWAESAFAILAVLDTVRPLGDVKGG